jgi:hypothetical protein
MGYDIAMQEYVRGSKTKTKKLFANEAHSVEFLIIWQLKQHKTYVKD